MNTLPTLILIEPVPHYLAEQSDPDNNRYVFAYTITLRNQGERPARLIARHWVITHADGRVEEVRGEGVVGETPRLTPGMNYSYTSGTVFNAPVGAMEGSYTFVTDEGQRFVVPIPRFTLSIPRVLH
ncbi:MAG: Co2+/Mg2+ efflux protein ApaG [Halothiobacillaceae bacterium]|jgi:ApaG protein|nr:Co2+/Mg2+ efflux protein ApaG [Halothiobacillaceae bacterium]